jgi:hypothetical protein
MKPSWSREDRSADRAREAVPPNSEFVKGHKARTNKPVLQVKVVNRDARAGSSRSQKTATLTAVKRSKVEKKA